MILDAFSKTYQDKAYQYTTMVQHKEALVVFTMDADRHIYYNVLDLSAANRVGHLPAAPGRR
jgi:hypothetical protein